MRDILTGAHRACGAKKLFFFEKSREVPYGRNGDPIIAAHIKKIAVTTHNEKVPAAVLKDAPTRFH
ncbi:MAG: hypothetical protein JRL30_24410 [Deltaproteobacteria bacterium]|nr:hypothetical protein [Deltaproteobacteria bacterium]